MEALNGRNPFETITIDVSEMRNLRGSKGESYTLFAKIEFDGRVIGETPKVEAVDRDATFSYTCTMECCLSDDISAKITLDDIASKPLLISFIEVLPKEKKQKEEKTQLLGQCTVDMLPLVCSCKTEISDCQFIFPVALLDGNKTSGSVIAPPVERTTITSQGLSEGDISKPEAEIRISVVTPLLDEEMIKNTNLFTVRAGSAYSLPDGFLTNSNNFSYGIGFPVTSSSKETYLYFQGGSVKLSHEKEPKNRRLKWYNVNSTAPGSQYISGLTYEKVAREDENGDFFNTNQNEEFRYEAENEKPRVTWDIEKRCFLDVDAKSMFRSMITQKRILPVDIFRIVNEKPKDKTATTKKEKMAVFDSEDHGHLLYHGVCYVDMGPLLYPGMCKIAGAFKVHPYNETELEKRTGRRSTLAQEEVFKLHQKNVSVSPVHNRAKNQAASKRMSVMVRGADSNGSTAEVDNNVAPDAKEYQDFNSFVYLELSLSRPLIPKRNFDELSQAISHMIPPRPIVKLQVGGAEKALKDYHSQLTSVAHMILDDFRKMYGEQISKDELDFNPEEQIKRKRELYYELNTSGKYFAYKEQLKHSIVKIVREKFMKTSVFSSPEDLQQFLSELYVYLIDQMHVCLGKFLSLNEDNPQIANPEITSSQLKQFAEEAFDEGNFKQASDYFKQRIVKNDRDATCWLDFGIYHLRMGDVIKAKECFKESIALDQNFTEGLIMHGIVSTLETKFEEAELVLERSTNLINNEHEVPHQVAPYLPWLVLSVFYEFSDNQFLAEHAFREGSKIAAGLNIKETRDETYSKKEEVDVKPQMKSNSALSFPNHHGGPLKVKTNFISTKPAASVLSNKHETQEQQHTGEKSEEVASNEPGMYLLAADWLIKRHALNYAECLLSRELVTFGGSIDYYTLLSKLHARQGNHQLASEAISKAIALDIENAESWAISGHLAHSSGNVNTMRDCYERTIAFVTDAPRMHTILLRLAKVYLDEEKHLKAKQTYLMASKYAFTCLTWLGVGISCYRLQELDEAEEALSEANVLNNTNPVVWGFLALVTMRTRRKLEAEQCFKFATKLGLSDEKLLNEIEQLQNKLGWGNPSFVTF